jgi:hypothetical protein
MQLLEKLILEGVRFRYDSCFPDGKGGEITAEDVQASYLRAIDTNRWFYQLAKQIRKIAIEYYGDDFRFHPVGSKPFRLAELDPG